MNLKNSSQNPPHVPTSGRMGRLAQLIEQEAGREILLEVMQDGDKFEAISSSQRKAAWVRAMIQRLDRMVDPQTATRIMNACGRVCCGTARGQQARQLWLAAGSLEEFVQKLNEKRLGGGRLKLIDPATIAGGYDQCYCGLVKQTKEPFPTLTYCQCSAGWYKQLFETAFAKPVRVDLAQSIIAGAKSCEFVIHI